MPGFATWNMASLATPCNNTGRTRYAGTLIATLLDKDG